MRQSVVMPMLGSNNGFRCRHRVSNTRRQNRARYGKEVTLSNDATSMSLGCGSKRSFARRSKSGKSIDRHLPAPPSFFVSYTKAARTRTCCSRDKVLHISQASQARSMSAWYRSPQGAPRWLKPATLNRFSLVALQNKQQYNAEDQSAKPSVWENSAQSPFRCSNAPKNVNGVPAFSALQDPSGNGSPVWSVVGHTPDANAEKLQ